MEFLGGAFTVAWKLLKACGAFTLALVLAAVATFCSILGITSGVDVFRKQTPLLVEAIKRVLQKIRSKKLRLLILTALRTLRNLIVYSVLWILFWVVFRIANPSASVTEGMQHAIGSVIFGLPASLIGWWILSLIWEEDIKRARISLIILGAISWVSPILGMFFIVFTSS